VTLLSVGQGVGGRYIVQAEVGRGGMQEVYRARDQTLQRDVALKVPQDARVARKFRESAVLSARVNHPNVAKTLDYFEDSSRFYMVEELVIGENLREVLGKFDRLDAHAAAYILHHLARAVTASHRAGVVHRDLKPSNIMVPGGLAFDGVKVTDFGIAKMAEHEVGEAVSGGEESTRASRTVMNALAYVAPEVIESPRTPGKPADVWAIAAIAWEVLTGEPPFGSGLRAIKLLVTGKLPPLPTAIGSHPQFGGLSREVGDVIASCLQVDADIRPTAEELSKRCDALCYFPPRRELGTIENYRAKTFGFIEAEKDEAGIFFHVKNVVADKPKPPVGTRVWFTRFEGEPRARAFPVVPLKVDAR
jgi:eukaryotic-like serine/threonine-protein kinase